MVDHLFDHWESRAVKYGISHDASWEDKFAMQLEIDTIKDYIKKDNKVLDVGCANGYSTLSQLDKEPSLIVGVDFSPAMIEAANQAKQKYEVEDKATFQLGDIENLDFQDNTFDVVYTTRVLINLPTWERQQRGIQECLRVCKSGGVVIFSEAFWEPLMLLNAMRLLNSLDILTEPDFNRYIKKNQLEQFLSSLSFPFSCIDFSAVYYLGTRFLRELIGDISGFDSPFHKLFYDLERIFSGGNFGIQQAYVVRK